MIRLRFLPALFAAAILALLAVPAFAQAEGDPADPLLNNNGLVQLPPVIPGGGRLITPMAIPDTYNLGDTDPRGYQQTIATTMRRCFEISGYFDIYGPDRYFFDPNEEGMTASTIDFRNWYNVGAQALVKTSFRVAGPQVALDFRLYDIDTQNQIDVGWVATTVNLDGVVDEVYNFVNKVIEYYTGSLGIFGSRIAFTGRSSSGHKNIFTMSMDGSGMGHVTENGSINLLPTFGPGGQVMYTSYLHGNPDLFIGNDNAEVFSGRPGFQSGAALSPSGSEIAVTMSVHGNAEIYVLDLSGDIIRRCTNNNAEDVTPTWSPGGDRIAFVSDRSGNPQIFVMNADCSGQARVTFQGNHNTEPDWSPLGDRIAFTGRDSENRFDIFTVEPSSNYIERLTQDQGDNKHASWSPDGRYLVFQSTRGGGTSLWVMTEDGQFQHNITPNGAGYETPVWER